MLVIEVTAVCVWRLVTMARSGTVFSHAAFRDAHIKIGALIVVVLRALLMQAVNRDLQARQLEAELGEVI